MRNCISTPRLPPTDSPEFNQYALLVAPENKQVLKNEVRNILSDPASTDEEKAVNIANDARRRQAGRGTAKRLLDALTAVEKDPFQRAANKARRQIRIQGDQAASPAERIDSILNTAKEYYESSSHLSIRDLAKLDLSDAEMAERFKNVLLGHQKFTIPQEIAPDKLRILLGVLSNPQNSRHLRALDVGNAPFERMEDIEALMASFETQSQLMKLVLPPHMPVSVNVVTQTLVRNSSLTQLNVSLSTMTAEQANAFVGVIGRSQLQGIVISTRAPESSFEDNIGEQINHQIGTKALSRALTELLLAGASHLDTILLRSSLGNDEARWWRDVIASQASSLRVLSLSDCNLTDESVFEVADAITEHSNIQVLHLTGNGIRDNADLENAINEAGQRSPDITIYL